ncbi:hypothetical protein [Bartonella sp. B17]
MWGWFSINCGNINQPYILENGLAVEKRELRIFSISILSVCFVLTGCSLSAPTYGTGRIVSVRFLGDIAESISLKPKKSRSQLMTAPRPQLVFPKVSSHITLPLPQKGKDIIQSGFSTGTASRQYYSDSRGSVISKKVSSVN